MNSQSGQAEDDQKLVFTAFLFVVQIHNELQLQILFSELLF